MSHETVVEWLGNLCEPLRLLCYDPACRNALCHARPSLGVHRQKRPGRSQQTKAGARRTEPLRKGSPCDMREAGGDYDPKGPKYPNLGYLYGL